MKAFYQCAKITQSLQHNMRPLFALGFIVFFFKRLNVFNLSAATKKLITSCTFFINSFMAQVPLIYKPVHSLAEQINGLASL